jgi:hypothetical protein
VAFTDLHEIEDMFAGLSVFERAADASARSYHLVPGQSYVRRVLTEDSKLDGPAKAARRAWNRRKRSDPEYRKAECAAHKAWRQNKRATDPEWAEKERRAKSARHMERYRTEPGYRERHIAGVRRYKDKHHERVKAKESEKRIAVRTAREAVLGPDIAARIFRHHSKGKKS